MRLYEEMATENAACMRYDAAILSLPEYAQPLGIPQRFIMPAINPFSTTNKGVTDAKIDGRLAHYGIPDDLPLVAQVSRFVPWKDRGRCRSLPSSET